MGCGLFKNQVVSNQPNQNNSEIYRNIGLLKVQIKDFKFHESYQILSECQKFQAKLSVSNQIQNIQLRLKFDQTNQLELQQNAFEFIINKLDEQRMLKVQLFSRLQLSNKEKLAQGKQNITQLISRIQNDQNSNQKVFSCQLFSQQKNKIGFFIFHARFFSLPYQILTIKVDSVTLRQTFSKFRKIYIRIQIGEQMFQSVSAIQTEQNLPQWNDAFYSFIIPLGLNIGTIQVYQKNEILKQSICLGELKFDMISILSKKQTQIYCEQLKNNQFVTGTINLRFMRSKNLFLQNVPMKSLQKISIEDTKSKNNTPKTVASDKNNQQFSFQINIKKQKQSQPIYSKKMKNSSALYPLQSAPIFKNYENQKKLINSINKLNDISQNPQNLSKKHVKQSVKQSTIKFNSKKSNETPSSLPLQKTDSLTIKKKKQDEQLRRDFVNKTNIRRVSSSSQEDEQEKHQEYSNFESKGKFQQQNMQYSRTRKFNSQNYINQIKEKKYSNENQGISKILSKVRINQGNRQQVGSSVVRFGMIENDLESKSLIYFKNSVVKIDIDDTNKGSGEIDFSLKETSNVKLIDASIEGQIEENKQRKFKESGRNGNTGYINLNFDEGGKNKNLKNLRKIRQSQKQLKESAKSRQKAVQKQKTGKINQEHKGVRKQINFDIKNYQQQNQHKIQKQSSNEWQEDGSSILDSKVLENYQSQQQNEHQRQHQRQFENLKPFRNLEKINLQQVKI